MGLFRSTQVVVAIIVLCAIGFGVFFYKVMVLSFPLTPDQDTDLWSIETLVSFQGRGEPVEIRVARLQDTSHLAVISESAIHTAGFGVVRTRIGEDRFMRFERRAMNARGSVYYRAVVVELDSAPERGGPRPAPDTDYDAEARRILADEDPTPFVFALDTLIESARERSASDTGFVAQLVESLADSEDDLVQGLSAGGPEGIEEPARRLALILNAAEIPARRVSGLILGAGPDASELQTWVDVWLGGRWRALDPVSGEELDERFLMPLTHYDRPVYDTVGVDDVSVSYSIARRSGDAAIQALDRAETAAPIVATLSLLTLPQHTQTTFRVIMLIPVGAMLIAFLRQIVGLAAFGTFMPVLIAIAFRETSLLTGVAVFSGIVMVGLGLRAYFNGLQLLIVPRLAVVLSFVTLIMAGLALLGSAFSIPLGFSISLFPLVIMTMTIERMSLVWDEFGAREALMRGGGSLVAASLAYLVMTNDYVEHLAFMFPELLLVTIAMMIALGRYNGYKLTEYFRFRTMADPDVR